MKKLLKNSTYTKTINLSVYLESVRKQQTQMFFKYQKMQT